MAVQVEPAAIQVPASGGNVSLQLMNGNPEVRFAFKLKSSNNEHYRVNPVFGFVEPGAAAQVEVIRQNGPPKGDDKLEICFAGAPPDAGDAKAIFPPGSSGEFKVDVPMAAA
ncbi:unnamed protein product [Meloidogyne enterolobii]|nr:unnamed protein product [Meloidogyne enterolobii]CAD2202486.1 unnamed protein product [Meloidogyne enterolobii]CAD2206133.1 unnamed protein product [Meloidogyne enterolobii]